MTQQLFIDGKPFDATRFAFDGCHKIYLMRDGEDLSEYGWDEADYHPITELADAWEDSCFLRFISWGDLSTVIPQCHEDEVVIEVRDLDPSADSATTTTDDVPALLARLRAAGCAVIAFEPDELDGIDPRRVEDAAVDDVRELIELMWAQRDQEAGK